MKGVLSEREPFVVGRNPMGGDAVGDARQGEGTRRLASSARAALPKVNRNAAAVKSDNFFNSSGTAVLPRPARRIAFQSGGSAHATAAPLPDFNVSNATGFIALSVASSLLALSALY
ncbi:ectonucleoside triphosphate diphosphohydrolase 1 [Pseudozyma hubeiensis SY62]|uniref:Ectonucleoside triphosphate diphosphohydrolase 1 n=1 Tax=Pseudozyma hubeiensis (strain SY62) TaxID=1305764 RepID=R9PAN1_PSEHS|nr:ectonucleoside triphosphate diphosphohydrolase 1 [Pseudozyma hubeiensis SY62]GAC98394.1 ectonucleoside triphosphate diphosphohydrolase 1 [Pseudozyma hubeiensis SY62]